MTTDDHLFLIVFNRDLQTSRVEDVGHDLSDAMQLLANREHDVAEDPNVEVVLIGSPSLDTLRRTHSSYFGAADSFRPVIARANGS